MPKGTVFMLCRKTQLLYAAKEFIVRKHSAPAYCLLMSVRKQLTIWLGGKSTMLYTKLSSTWFFIMSVKFSKGSTEHLTFGLLFTCSSVEILLNSLKLAFLKLLLLFLTTNDLLYNMQFNWLPGVLQAIEFCVGIAPDLRCLGKASVHHSSRGFQMKHKCLHQKYHHNKPFKPVFMYLLFCLMVVKP